MSDLAGKRVFVVEDEVLVLMMLTDILEELGMEVVATASNLEQAVGLARKTEFDFALLDVNLLGKLSYPVADILMQRNIPFAFATGYGEAMTDQKSRTVPVLVKPYDADGLKQTLSKLAAVA